MATNECSMILWRIAVLFFLAFLTLTSGNFWSEWSAWSDCSRTCDGGATYQTRRCVRSRSYRRKCLGNAIRYSTCNNEPCPSGLPDFRSEQCAAYDDASYSGRYFRWLPYHEKDNPCALTCIAEGTKLVAVLAPKVLDGTRCNTHSLDMCINGECRNVGCDHILGSNKAMDSCGVCGGNSTCEHERRSVALRNRWIETSFGPCSVTCGIGVQEKRLLCFDTYRGKIVDSLYCENIIRPADTRQTCSMGACPPEWRVGPWQNCTRDCGGGVSWRIVTCVQTFEDGTQQLVRDSLCKSLRPSSRKSCNGYICPTWYAGEWSICSVSCGTGIQKRDVICRHVGDSFCRDSDKPRTMKNCTTGIPCYNLNGDIQERHVGEFKVSEDGSLPQSDQAFITREDLYTPRFVSTTWGACSATCGEGVKFRYVRCQVFLQYLDDFVDLPDGDCEEEKPADRAPCMVEPCYDQYEWMAAGMTECSVTCLGGIQETILKCVTRENQTVVGDEFCLEAPHVQTERRICNDRPCPQRWDLGKFGECSVTCGGGLMTRTVKCIQEIAHGPRVITLPDFMCSRPMPANVSACNEQPCPAYWSVGNWSKCSVTCGIGIEVRKLLCQRRNSKGVANVSLLECDSDLRPETERTCNAAACPEPMIKTRDIQLFQLKPMPRLRLLVGMKASVLPETTIIVKCPNVGLDRQKITWFKNGMRFRRSKRARVARSGALRIRQARPGIDGGVYSCLIGGLKANVTIKFHSGYEILQARLTRDEFVFSPESARNLMNGTHMFQDPVDRKPKPLVLMSTDWTQCSVTCGGGLQSRNMSCEIITEEYYQILNKEDCFKHLKMKPLLIQSCNTLPCVKWQAGNWSECSDRECVRHQYSIQRRAVECVNEFNNTVTEDRYCQELKFPPDNVRNCLNPNCTAMWNTSRWSECMAPCDESGVKTRVLSCVWAHSGDMAPLGSCDLLEQPRTSRRCKGPSCDELVCEDESDYCSIVKMMNMCKYSNFLERCCWTCNEDYYYYDYEDGEEVDDNDAVTS